MRRQSKFIGSIVVIFACGAVVAGSGAAERRQTGSDMLSTNSRSNRGGGNDVANEATRRSPSAPTNGRFGRVAPGTAGDPGGKTAAVGGNSAVGHGINLVTPDDGYSDVSRRGPSLMLNSRKRDLRRTIPLAPIARPQLSPGGPAGLSRNALGITIPNAGKNARSVGTRRVSALPVTTGFARNSVGVSEIRRPEPPHAAPVPTGGGTTTRNVIVGAGTVGGPAKNQSLVNGSVLRHKF